MLIRQLREAHGMSQKELGDKLGVAQNAISNYERGARTPDARTLEAMADLFGVSVDYLMGRRAATGAPLTREGDSAALRSLARGARALDDAQQKQLLELARVLFKDAFREDEA